MGGEGLDGVVRVKMGSSGYRWGGEGLDGGDGLNGWYFKKYEVVQNVEWVLRV